MAFGDVIARLSVVLGMDTAAFETDARRAGRASKDLGDKAEDLGFRIGRMGKAFLAAGTAIAGAAIVGQITDMVKAGLEHASALGEEAAQLGVTTKALQQYRYAASQAGVGQEEMDQALAQLTKRMGLAAEGSKKPLAAFEALGIPIASLVRQGKDAGDVIPLIAEGLAKIASPAQRAAIEVDLFGKAGQKLEPLLAGGAKGVNDLRNQAEKLGLVLSDKLINDADEAADKMSALNQVLQAKIAGAVAANAKEISYLADALVNLIDKAGEAVRWWRNLQNTIGASSKAQGQIDRANAIIDRRTDLSSGSKSAAKSMARQIIERRNGVRTESVGGFLGAIGLKQTTAVGTGASVGQLAALSRIPILIGDIGDQAPKVDTLAAAAERLGSVSGKLGDAWASLGDRLFPEVAALRRYREDLATIADAEKKGLSANDAYEARRRLALEGTESTGLSDFLAGTDEPLGRMDGLSEALEKLIDQTGLLGDRSRAATAEMSLGFEEAGNRVVGALDQMASAFRGGGFLDKLGSVLDLGLQLGSIGAFGKSVQSNIRTAKVPGHALGTGNAARGLALVGERGPELVRFNGGESVFSNRQSREMLGGRSLVEIVDTTGLFVTRVNGQIMQAAPGIATAGAGIAQARSARSAQWSLDR